MHRFVRLARPCRALRQLLIEDRSHCDQVWWHTTDVKTTLVRDPARTRCMSIVDPNACRKGGMRGMING